MIKDRAEGSRVDIDAVLSEALFAFYWLSNGRKVTIGISGVIEHTIELSDIREYYNTFIPRMEYPHFLRVIRAADIEHLRIKAENLERTQKASDAKGKTK